jgi:2-succinyl-6-hydroxy-2,4-cyclohexadiene-1-carboxylate synthase
VIWCLHGFLGRGQDWSALRAACIAAGLPELATPDLFSAEPFGPRAVTLAAWGHWLAEHVARLDPDPVLVGYSLGGRLALHALLAPEAAWRAAVIVSAHPGLETEAERIRRRDEDERWARRFTRDPWDALLTAWNARDVFAGAPAVHRPESAYDRPALAAALRHWSLGAQEPLFNRLREIRRRVLWIAGERDERYVTLGRAAAEGLWRGEMRVAPGAGHRVPWDAAQWFEATVINWLNQ